MIKASTAAAAARRGYSARRTPRWQRSLKYGAPFVLFLVGGLYGMGEILGLKYERIDARVIKQSERQFELQEEHKVSVVFLSISAPCSISTHPMCSGNNAAPNT